MQKRKCNTDVKTTTETNEYKRKQSAPGSGDGDHSDTSIKSTAHTSPKPHCVQKGEGNTDAKTTIKKETTAKTNECKTKQDAPVSSEADDTNTAINNMVRC